MNIYGRIPEEKIQLVKQRPNINCHGFVGIDKIREAVNDVDILIHVESLNPIIMPQLKYAFSTKIAQYLCSGRCILSYAPIDMASTQYFLGTDSAVVANDKDGLRNALVQLLENAELRKEYSAKALNVAVENHNRMVVSREIRRYLLGVVNEA